MGTELHRQSLEIAARYPAPWWGGMWVWIFLMEILGVLGYFPRLTLGFKALRNAKNGG